MSTPRDYSTDAPARTDVDALKGAAVIEFGTGWCGYCRAAEPHVVAAFADHPQVQHLKVEDGPGRALGRSYRVKLWPTLIFLKDGQEVARLVRPGSRSAVSEALAAIDPR